MLRVGIHCERELDAEGKLPLGDRAWAMVGKRAVIRATPIDVSRWIVVNCFCMSHSSFDGCSQKHCLLNRGDSLLSVALEFRGTFAMGNANLTSSEK